MSNKSSSGIYAITDEVLTPNAHIVERGYGPVHHSMPGGNRF